MPDIERGLLIGGNDVPASSGRLADDVSPWDGQIYARVAAGTPADITRAADAAQAACADGELHGLDQRRAHHRGPGRPAPQAAVLELGGKNGLIILEDADPDLAVDAAVFGAFMNSGQICMSTDRIIIYKSLVETFVPRYVERVKALTVGDPADPATIVGPLIHTRGAQRVSKLVEDAAKGTSLLTGDGAIEGPNGTLIRPVVLTDVTADMDIFASEIFGPATVIHTVDSTKAAIDLANDTEYGLTGGVISRDLSAALDAAGRVRSGIIHINDQGIGDEPMAPFGGVKNSGYGKFGGTAGIESFTERRWVTIQHSDRPRYPF